jgi:type 1 glutamine amidotransferase
LSAAARLARRAEAGAAGEYCLKKALIIHGGWEGHQPRETAELVAADLRHAGFEVDLADNLQVLLDADKLREVDLLVPNWTMAS